MLVSVNQRGSILSFSAEIWSDKSPRQVKIDQTIAGLENWLDPELLDLFKNLYVDSWD